VRPVNLIPPEDRRGDHAPLRAGAASYAIVGILALALIGVVLVILSGNKINDSKAELAGLEARKAQADLGAADLAPYGQFATLEQTRSATVSSLAQSRFDWERVLNELALVLPERVTLDALTGTAGAGTSVTGGTSSGADPSITGPSLQIGGCAEGQRGVARFLAALKDIDGVTRVGMSSSELGAATAGTPATPASTDAGAVSTDCQSAPSIARFQVTVAFDAVPAPVTATPPTATPAATAPATTTPATTTTDESGIAATQATEQSAVDSANKQTSAANNGAAAVGVGN
jgi:Tfp pilus assembly protein PilN